MTRLSVEEFVARRPRNGHLLADDGVPVSMGHAIPPEAGRVLQSLIRESDARVVVEIGMALGISTLYMAEALHTMGVPRRLVVADPFQHDVWHGIGLKDLRECGLDSVVEFHPTFSHRLLPRLEEDGLCVDFAFVDGNHLFDYALMDFVLLDRMLRPGGILVFDDVSRPSVRKVLRYVLTNRAYTADVGPLAAIAPHRRSFGEKFAFAVGRAFRSLAPRLLAPELTQSSWDLGLRSRFAVLRKRAPDNRGDQETFHHRF